MCSDMRDTVFIVNVNGHLTDNSRKSIEDAVDRWGCDLYVADEETMKQCGHDLHPATLKTRAFDLVDAERLLLLDADVAIRQDTPSPFSEWRNDGIIAVRNGSRRFSTYESIKEAERFEWSKIKEHFEKVPYEPWPYFNSGFILIDRKYQSVLQIANEICRKVGLGWQDQTPINFAAKYYGAPVMLIGETWNYMAPEHFHPDGNWNVMYKHIYHFAGCPDRLKILEQVGWRLS